MPGLVGLRELKDSSRQLRLVWVGMILLALIEVVVISVKFDSGYLIQGTGLTGLVANRLRFIPQVVAVICTATFVFGGKEVAECLRKMRGCQTHRIPLLFVTHLVVFSIFIAFSSFFFEVDRGADARVFVSWGVIALATAATWFAVLVAPSGWLLIAKELSGPILVGCCVGALSWFVGQYAVEAWDVLGFATLQLVWFILSLCCVGASQNSSLRTIGTKEFEVTIAPECSGYEGMGLAVVFISTYLWWKRDEHPFPRSLLLIPASVGLMFVVNAIRIALLILIGHFGAQEIAVGGFHSQAGWIGFNLVVLGLVAFARVSPFFGAQKAREDEFDNGVQYQNQSVPMLAPFVCLTLSIMLLEAIQTGFDWLYPVRFFAVAMVIGFFFKQYPKQHWEGTLHWTPVAIGVAVYLIWNFLETDDGGTAKTLFESARSLSPVLFLFWLAFRILGSVITVPLAEEFAFRGYLLPWLAGEQSRNWSWGALIVSSVAFGLLHPGRWAAGTIAGILYGIAYYRNGKVMDAVLAHAITNALIAVEAILFSRWYLWG